MKLYQISEPQPNTNEVIAGIDLGTTNSLIGIYDSDKVQIIPDKYNEKGIVPSIVSFDENKQQLKVGHEALDNPQAIKSVKRILGKGLKDTISNLYNIDYQESSEEILKIKLGNRTLSGVEVSAEILKYLKANAEEHSGKKIKKAVITVPAHFDDAARTATKDAATMAGIEVLRILNEPTAAAIAYGLNSDHNKPILVYDLGGGTFDVSILKRNHGIMVVVATSGDNQLGGDDFDLEILKLMYRKIEKNLQQTTVVQLELANYIKKYLSDNPIWIGNFMYQTITITRDEISAVCKSLIDRTFQIMLDALFAAKLKPQEIGQVILAGGATRMPVIQSTIEKFFNKKPLGNINPDQVVAIGATLQAHALTNGGNVLVDVVPLSLGIELLGGIVETIIARNTPIPTIAKKYYTTYKDNQTGFKIHILQGEGDTVKSCRSLARIELSDLPAKPAGEVKLEVVFKVNADGMLFVSATELDSGKSCNLEVKPSYGLSEDEVEKLLQEQKNAS
jgi:molecular chaperone HscA